MPGYYVTCDTAEEAEAGALALMETHKNVSTYGLSPPKYRGLPVTQSGQLSSTFKTEDHTYYIVHPEDGIGFERWSELNKLLVPMQFGQRDFEAVKAYWTGFMNETVNNGNLSDIKVDIVQRVSSFLDGVTEQTDKRWHQGAYLCSLFVIREGEDLTKWNRSLAEDKIEDWNNSGFDFQQFFFVAANLSDTFLTVYQSRIKEAKEKQFVNATSDA